MKPNLKNHLTRARKAGRIPNLPDAPELPSGFATRISALRREEGSFVVHLRNTAVAGFAVAAVSALVIFSREQPANKVADLPASPEQEWFDMPMLTPPKQ